MTVRVLIADDHPVVRAGVTALLDTDPDIEIVATAATPFRGSCCYSYR